jgi:hypothetical protein
MAACSSPSRRASLPELGLDPGLKFFQRVERRLELAQLGAGGGLVHRAEQAQRLEPLDRDSGQLAPRPFLISACRNRERARSARAERLAASPASASA